MADRGDRPARPARDEADDEPLPASYGSRPPAEEGSGGPRRSGDEEGERSSRRRRRGRRGREGRPEGEPRRASEPRGGERRSSDRGRSRSCEGRSSSRSRGRRDDFAPVAGGYNEDDEGLEFLGVEEAAQESGRRARPAEEDEDLVESGLPEVRDVPSWVEAIGIVIGGNLLAREKSGRGDQRGGRGR